MDFREEKLHEALLVRCRAERIEPPGRGERMVGSARSTFEQRFCERTVAGYQLVRWLRSVSWSTPVR
ncbi:hypothetical protein OH799_29525 [Nocardia sp. NBC_00881]|uniref:hypothetical protein n=1 Tax=Nocardia sp. NBC_00881 TaxID=2975995 RepID=UPI00386D93BD|nr:hypothetical protein OH799_29525 [Nocardia sp. NBC_00881]